MDKSTKEKALEEARRAKAIALEKYRARDFVGAKEFAVKAYELYPALCGLLCIKAVLDVMIGYEKKINNEADWYAVLSLDPTADIETIQDRYSKLFSEMILDNDMSMGNIDEAKDILADSLIYIIDAAHKKRQVELRSQNLVQSAMIQKGKSIIKQRFESFVSDSQESKQCNDSKRVKRV